MKSVLEVFDLRNQKNWVTLGVFLLMGFVLL
jgi:hypothetical protein